MKYYFIILSLILFGCKSNQNKAKIDSCNIYPSIIDSLKVKDLYDSARWFVYTLQCDEKYLPKSDTSKSITFGELSLDFHELVFKHDTIVINFDFMDDQRPIIAGMTRDYKQLSTGVGFNMKTREKIFMLFSGGIVSVKGSETRYENPLQPEVITYIKSNKDKLNPCFRVEAKRRKIIE